MEIHELVIEMKLLERRLTLYEEKYGVLSEDFYTALLAGKLSAYDEYDETRADFSRWKGILMMILWFYFGLVSALADGFLFSYSFGALLLFHLADSLFRSIAAPSYPRW